MPHVHVHMILPHVHVHMMLPYMWCERITHKFSPVICVFAASERVRDAWRGFAYTVGLDIIQ